MNNAEFFKDAGALMTAHRMFNEVFIGSADADCVKEAAANPYIFATKAADYALQAELKVGSLVQIKTSIHGECVALKYATVVRYAHPNKDHSGIPFVDKVLLRFATGEEYMYDVRKRVYGPLRPDGDMERGDIKVAEVPAELVKLVRGCVNLEKCPSKKEGACLED